MAIVNMSKFNLVIFETKKSQILKKLQKFKEVDFIDIKVNEDSSLSKIENNVELANIEEELTNVHNSLSLLKKYHNNEKGLRDIIKGNDKYTYDELSKKVVENYNWKEICEILKKLGNEEKKLSSQIAKYYGEINELMIWNRLDVNPNNLFKMKQVKSFLGSIPIKLKNNFISEISKLEYLYYEELKITKEEIYYLIISYKNNDEIIKLEEILKENNFSLNNLEIDEIPKDRIEYLKKEIEILKEARNEVKEKIKKYEGEIKELEAVFDYLRNKKLRIETIEKLAKTKKVCIVNGWLPTNRISEFEEIIKNISEEEYYIDFEMADKRDEKVPIKLKNGKIATSFENLTGMYAYPKYNEIDPTPFIAPFYIIFFGMMGADAGYGALLLLMTWGVLKFTNLSKKTKLFIEFFFYLSFSVIIWGILYGSYFGMTIPGLWRLINPATEYNKLLVGSVLFGIIHIYFGLGLKAYLLFKEKKHLDVLYDVVFWYMALTGGILYLTLKILSLSPKVATVSGIISVVGMIGIIFTGGREAKSIGGKLGGGLYSLYGISGYVGDFVSYSRLMALGLSGGFIAQAINMIIGMVSGSLIGVVFIPLIFVGGHFFNMFLSFLGGYVHTSRLMYVEFFGKFYEGGGRPFKDFCVENKFIDLED